MKLFILRGFETWTYTTHTMFVATSLEEAERLCNEVYDYHIPRYLAHLNLDDLEQVAQKAQNDIVNRLKTSINEELAKDEPNRAKVTAWKKEDNALYHKHIEIEGDNRYELADSYYAMSALLDMPVGAPKALVIADWMKYLHVVDTDALLHDKTIDGD